MVEIQIIKRCVARLCAVVLFVAGAAVCGYSQVFIKAEWSRVKMDSTWNYTGGKSTEVINKYRPAVDSLLIPIGTTTGEFTAYPPEDRLSNLAGDIMLQYGSDWLAANVGDGVKADMSITNFGGIRASMPGGAVTSFDVISIFPFDNKIMILDLQGKYVRMLMENFAKRGRVEVMGGVRLKIEDNVLVECTVAGEPVDDERIYKVVAIDFLLGGGDSVYALKYATNVEDTGSFLRDVIIAHIRSLTAQGRVVEAHKDGRVVIVKAQSND